jgi:hypothetical protein
MDLVYSIAITGVGATATMDLWALVRRSEFGVPLPNYGHVARWLLHMRHARFRHAAIAAAPPVAHETALGWGVHYAIGIAYAALLPLAFGASWFAAPHLGQALALGLATTAAPFLLMQPGMGAGLLARRAPRPNVARGHTLVNHLVFGVGLYLTASSLP